MSSKFATLVKEVSYRLSVMTPEQVAVVEQQVGTLDAADAVSYLNLNAESAAMGMLGIAESQAVYWTLTPLGWRTDTTLAEKVAATTLIGALITMKVDRIKSGE